MRKDILNQIVQLYDNVPRKQQPQSLFQQEKELFNPFQDDHILRQEDISSKPFYMHSNQFQNAKKEIIKTCQPTRIKSHSLDKTVQQIQAQRAIYSQVKQNRRSQLKSQISSVSSVIDQQISGMQAFNGIQAKKLKIFHQNMNDKSTKDEQTHQKDSIQLKNNKLDDNFIDENCLEEENLENNLELNNSNIIEQKDSEDHQLNIFENTLLKQMLQENKVNSSSIENSPFCRVQELNDNLNQKDQFSGNNLLEKKDNPIFQQQTRTKQPKKINSKSSSLKCVSKEMREFYQFKEIIKKDKIQPNQNGQTKYKCKTENFSHSQSQKVIIVNPKPINYIEYAIDQMQKQQMEVNIEQAAFTPVQISEKPLQNKSKSLNKNKNICINEKDFMKIQNRQQQFQDDLNDSLSNAGSRMLPKNNNENNISKDHSNSYELYSISRSLQRNSTEQSILSQKNKQALFKKYLPKLQKQSNQIKFVKIVQKSFGDDSSDIQSTSINSERKTPNHSNFRDSPVQRRRMVPQEKENSLILKPSSSSFNLNSNENTKSLNKLSSICRQKNVLNSTVQEQLQSFEEATKRLQIQNNFQRVYQFVHNKRIGINHLIELSHILQKQK